MEQETRDKAVFDLEKGRLSDNRESRCLVWKQALEPLIASRPIKRGMEARSMVERALGLAGYNGCNEARWNRLFKSNKTLVSKNERFDLLRAFQ